jgi:hemolysin-activating ACP:hemolysin acyltransferase
MKDCQEAINEIDNFIVKNDVHHVFTETRHQWRWNYFLHLARLYQSNQIMIQRNDKGQLIGICGWILVSPEDEHKINKTTWALPKNISEGNNLYVTICVINGGDIHKFRSELSSKFGDKVDEVIWVDVENKKFVRRRNIIKEMAHA